MMIVFVPEVAKARVGITRQYASGAKLTQRQQQEILYKADEPHHFRLGIAPTAHFRQTKLSRLIRILHSTSESNLSAAPKSNSVNRHYAGLSS